MFGIYKCDHGSWVCLFVVSTYELATYAVGELTRKKERPYKIEPIQVISDSLYLDVLISTAPV